MTLIKGSGGTEVIDFCTNTLKSTSRQDNPYFKFYPSGIVLKRATKQHIMGSSN